MAFLARCPWSLCTCPKRVDSDSGFAECQRCGLRFYAWTDARTGVSFTVEPQPGSVPEPSLW